MKQVILAALICVAWVFPAQAQEQDIEAVIGAQIEAFRSGDFVTAFNFASPSIRRVFETPENFETMVRRGFGVMLNPVDTQFLNRREEGGTVWQRVRYRDLRGEVYFYDYEMVAGPDGWKINAVMRVEMPKPSA